jgi:hypothetical protein
MCRASPNRLHLLSGVYADPSLEVDHRLRCQGVALLLPDGAPFAGTQDPVISAGN